MGTDIHLIIQAKRDGQWALIKPPETDNDYDSKYERWCSDRNYDAFAILADVRNGRGFAGVETGEVMIPVVPERRGLPPEIRPEDTDYDGPYNSLGDHSFHWLTLRELVDYPHWDKQRLVTGVVGSKQYHDEIKGKPSRVNDGPKEYSGGIMGRGIRTMTEAEYLAIGAPIDDKTYVQVQWPETYAFSAGTWYTKFLPKLRAWADEHGYAYEDVRLVFGFDS